MSKSDDKHILMAKRVARRWLRAVALPEYRIRVLYGAREIRNMTNLLYSFRDGRVAMQDCPRISDLGVKDDGINGIDLWSKDRKGLIALQTWFEKRGFETTGIW